MALEVKENTENIRKIVDTGQMDMFVTWPLVPLRWRQGLYKIVQAGVHNGKPYSVVYPKNDELVEEIKEMIQRENGLKVLLGDGFMELV